MKSKKERKEILEKGGLVRLVAINPKFRDKQPGVYTPAYNNKTKKYMTGQDLTYDQMIGKDPLGVKTADYTEIINPHKTYNIPNGTVIDKSDKRDLDLFLFYLEVKEIANSKNKIRKGFSEFYIEDKEIEAVVEVTSLNLIYDAMTKVKQDTSINRYRDIALFLGIKNTGILSPTMIEEKVLSECSRNPKKVLKFFDESSADLIFVKKLEALNVISWRREKGAFYDNELYLGRTTEEIVKWMHEDANKSTLSKWATELESKTKAEAESN